MKIFFATFYILMSSYTPLLAYESSLDNNLNIIKIIRHCELNINNFNLIKETAIIKKTSVPDTESGKVKTEEKKKSKESVIKNLSVKKISIKYDAQCYNTIKNDVTNCIPTKNSQDEIIKKNGVITFYGAQIASAILNLDNIQGLTPLQKSFVDTMHSLVIKIEPEMLESISTEANQDYLPQTNAKLFIANNDKTKSITTYHNLQKEFLKYSTSESISNDFLIPLRMNNENITIKLKICPKNNCDKFSTINTTINCHQESLHNDQKKSWWQFW